jgi:hypothetical protein
VRTHHQCLITEMFLSGTNLEYVMCFGPMVSAGEHDQKSRCKYVYVAINEVQRIGQAKNLSDVLRETLDTQLPLISIR